MSEQTVTREQAIEIIKSQEGKTFTVVFVKRTTGEVRRMNARFGVRKHFKTPGGVGRKYKPADHNLLCVFDMAKQAYRSINADTVTEVVADGTTYKVQQ